MAVPRGGLGARLAMLAVAAGLALSCRHAATLLVKQALRSPCLLLSEESALEVAVVDEQGRAVPGALVHISDEAGQSDSVETDANGVAAFPRAADGLYVAEVRRAGYVDSRISGLRAETGCATYTVVLRQAVAASSEANGAGRPTRR